MKYFSVVLFTVLSTSVFAEECSVETLIQSERNFSSSTSQFSNESPEGDSVLDCCRYAEEALEGMPARREEPGLSVIVQFADADITSECSF